jgi:hypothetical protein
MKKLGLWETWVAIRDELAAGGMTPEEARAEATRRVEAGEVARQESTPQVADGENPAAIEQELPNFSKRPTEREAAKWVAENLANPMVTAKDAPGANAWGLMTWVKKVPSNETTFWTTIWPKFATGKNDKQDDEDRQVDLGTEKSIALAKDLLKRLSEKHQAEGHCPTCGNKTIGGSAAE